MTKTRKILAYALVLISLANPVANESSADWAVRRSPFNPQIIGRYKSLLKRRPNDGYALVRLIRLYRKHRSIGRLIKEYQAAARANPKLFAYRVVLGHLFRRVGKTDKAIASYRAARKLRPKSAAVPAALAALYRKQGKKTEALASFKEALKLSRSKREKKRYLRALAGMALAERDLKGARAYYRQLVKLEPRNVFLRIELAQALGRAGNHTEAIAEYRVILARTRDTATRADILKQIGQQQHKLGKPLVAVATYRKAMSLAARGHWLRRELTERIITIYREKDDLKSLIAHYEKNWRRRGAFEYQVMGRLYDETGDEARALKAYRQALSKSRHAIDTRLRLIALLERAGQHKDVIAEYRKLARIAPGEPRYQLELAKRLYRAGNQLAALKVLERCGRSFPRDASAHSAIADLYARWGQHRRALREAQVLVRIEPRDESHLINLGEQYFLRGQKRKAIETWKRLLTAIPQRHKAYAKLAAIYAQHDLVKQAINLYNKAIKLSPKSIAYQRGLALLLERKRRSRPALKAWRAVVQLARKQAKHQAGREARTHIINILHRTYQLRVYIRNYRRSFDAGDLKAGFFLAEAHLKQRSFEAAAEVYRRIIKRQPKDIEALTALESVYRRQRKLAAAVVLLKKLAKLQPHSARDYYQRIANLQLQLYNDEEALVYAHKAVALSGKNAKAYQRLGELYEKKEDFKGAVDAYKKALALRPNLFAVHFALARLHTRGGRYAKAEEIYRKVLRTARAPELLRKAFRLGVDLSAYLGRLEVLEKEIHPLAVTHNVNAEVYRGILVDIYHRRVPPLMHLARHGNGKSRANAKAALHRIGVRGMAPLLEQLAGTGRSSTTRRLELIQLLGYLDNPNAVLPLLRLAEREPQEQTIVIYGKRSYRHSHHATFSRVANRVNQRVAATIAVGRLADERAVPGLTRLLLNREGSLREAAAWALSRIRHRRAPRALFESLADPRHTVQMMACAGLGIQGDHNRRQVLEEVMLDTGRQAQVRAACAWGLGALGDTRARAALTSVLKGGDDELQRCAAWSLGAMADRQAIGPLIRSLWNKRPEVRKAVVWALVRISSGKPISVARTDDVVVKEGRIDADQFLRRLTVGVDDLAGKPLATSLLGLVRAHRKEIQKGLDSALRRHRDILLRVLGDLDQHRTRPTLGPLTANMMLLNKRGRTEMIAAATNVAAGLLPRVTELVRHRDPLVRQRAVSVYAKLARKNSNASRPIKALLADRKRSVRTATLAATATLHKRGVLGRDEVLSLARSLLAAHHWREREAAVSLLGTLSHASATPALGQALKDSNGFVREAAARALARSGASAVSALIAALDDEVPHVRAAACRSLGHIGARRAAGPLKKRLQDSSSIVQKAARKAIGQLR